MNEEAESAFIWKRAPEFLAAMLVNTHAHFRGGNIIPAAELPAEAVAYARALFRLLAEEAK